MATRHNPALPAYDRTPGAGPTLVFLHYWGGSSRTWAPVTERLPGRDMLTIDLRGWSESKDLPGPYSLHHLAADTLAVVADAEVTNYVVVGHSMGGKVAQLVAATHPAGLQGLILVAPAPAKPAPEVTPEYQQGLSHAYDSPESSAMARDTILTASTLPESLKTHVLEDSRSSADEARTEWPLNGIAEDITAEAKRVNVPALILAGENDVVEPVDVLRHNLIPYLPGADLRVIAGTGHLIPLEAPNELAAAIAAFAEALKHESESESE